VKSILFLCGGELGCFIVILSTKGNAGMTETYRIMMDYEYQEKKNEIS
jgi:hypothetical protein